MRQEPRDRLRNPEPNKSKRTRRFPKPYVAMTSPSSDDVGVRTTSYPAIKNAPLPAEGSSTFSNFHLAGLVLGVPWLVKRALPLINRGGFYTYWFLVILLGVPITVAYWTVMSMYGLRRNLKVRLPGKKVEEYIEIKDKDLKRQFGGDKKIPMQVFHDAYFEGKIDFKGAFYAACRSRSAGI
jgi:hypothetical protein